MPRRSPLASLRSVWLRISLSAILPVLVLAVSPVGEIEAADLVLVPFAQSLDTPVGVVNAGDGSARLFVVEQGGDIEVFSASGTHLGQFLDITPLVSTGFEQGLLGLAFHPNYEGNGFFYVFYTDGNDALNVVRYKVSTNPNVADAQSAFPIITIAHPGEDNHNGGQLQFGPDGYLYIATGDGGGGGDPDGNGQDEDQLLGKILRIDVDSASPYASPPSNPLFGPTPGRDEIWATGLRNPWRFTFDRLTNDMFIGDVGQNDWEEVDFRAAGDMTLRNYGWNVMEGDVCFPIGTSSCDQTGMTLPIITYGHGQGCSITGGYRYRGGSTLFSGRYFYGDYCSGTIWTATLSGSTWSSSVLLDTAYSISSFGEDEAGELYLADAGGAVYRMLTDNDDDTVPPATDNCPMVANDAQTNTDAAPLNNGPNAPGDDLTIVKGDHLGDACDPDDDNDGMSDAAELVHPVAGCPLATAPLNPLDMDTDGDHLADGWECATGQQNGAPNNPTLAFDGSGTTDADGDHVFDVVESRGYNASGTSTDSDGDGCHDLVETYSIDGNLAVADADRIIVARRVLLVPPYAPDPAQDYVLDVDKSGSVADPDRILVARARFLEDWLPKTC